VTKAAISPSCRSSARTRLAALYIDVACARTALRTGRPIEVSALLSFHRQTLRLARLYSFAVGVETGAIFCNRLLKLTRQRIDLCRCARSRCARCAAARSRECGKHNKSPRHGSPLNTERLSFSGADKSRRPLYPPEADIRPRDQDVCFGPEADIAFKIQSAFGGSARTSVCASTCRHPG
jgi:hypothetical protein